jgi:alkylhydroperoxidase family enzyme
MLLAVAGQKEDEIKELTKKLASGNWSEFAPAEQLALQYAHKIAKRPSSVTADDMQGLTTAFGVHRTLDLVFYSGWCNYMTRVADAFQLPLERDNVFLQREKKKE